MSRDPATRVAFIKLQVEPGANLNDVCSEAVRLAMKREVPVHFEFNGDEYKISPKAIISFIQANVDLS